ncbi:gamma secretase complex protein [Allomyces arbusculus]|nr:gamma secretase complex protein [Allomyces arbusculus]
MTALSLIGNALISLGPAVVLFALFLARRPSLFLLALTSSFFALVALLFSSLIWYALPGRAESLQFGYESPVGIQAVAIVIAVLSQELVRWGSWFLIRRAEGGIMLASEFPRSPFHRFSMSAAFGYGYGLLIVLIMHITPLIESAGPGIRPAKSCPGVPDVLLASLLMMFQFLHHIAWTILLFHGMFSTVPPLTLPASGSTATLDQAAAPSAPAAARGAPSRGPGKWALVAYVFVSHMGVSMTSLTQSMPSIVGCIVPLVVSGLILAVSGYLVWGVVVATVKKAS